VLVVRRESVESLVEMEKKVSRVREEMLVNL
jgi:hypothetical protein